MVKVIQTKDTCVRCLRLVIDDYYRCTGKNHYLCVACHLKYIRCPNCNTKRKNRTKIIPRIVRCPTTKFYCENRPFGCTAKMTQRNRKKHENQCEFVPFQCPCNCTKHASLWSIHNHLPINNLQPEYWSDLFFYKVRKNHFERVILSHSNYLFLLEVQVHGRDLDALLVNVSCWLLNNRKPLKLVRDLPYRCDATIIRTIGLEDETSVIPINNVIDDRETCDECFFICPRDSMFFFQLRNSTLCSLKN